jgi:hypothetical protein
MGFKCNYAFTGIYDCFRVHSGAIFVTLIT